jgi:CDGSH-type Zn-finger protein
VTVVGCLSRAPSGKTLAVPRERDVLITPYRDGPLLVRGPVQVVGPDGETFTPRRDPIALCRCGKSRLRPFCDGTHKLVGFRAAGTAEAAPSLIDG